MRFSNEKQEQNIMNYYKIYYTIDDKNERVYPRKMKGIVFATTQDHATDHFMVGGTESTMESDGKSIIDLSADEAEALSREMRDSFPKPPPFPGSPVSPE